MRSCLSLLLALLLLITSAQAQQTRPASGKAKPATVKKLKAKTKPRAAATKSVAPAAKPVAKAKEAEEAPVIVFKKTPCYGSCPHYEATIYPDGRVAYLGYRNVPRMGAAQLQLPPAVVGNVLSQARELNFAGLQDLYSKGATDMPATIITIIQPDGKPKTVQVEEGAPQPLQDLLKYLGDELEKQIGVPVVSDH
ncbi:DUF6438 domain-containing protein [Hymenobacter sp. BT175]|uniref:DUF6438 domain-containing protein n=1 Tax=Hymenobacter translucens TaxID=2886507 RepID=UPI001D0E45C9|nr:DUF6438 domain-containing protein [Hymenobacter translucens]MCC2547124.1 DUF6438 domain-containing protein [Hymenobacter translucens]